MQLSGLNTFSAGTSIVASQMNANFTAVANVLNGNLGSDNFTTLTSTLSFSVTANVLTLDMANSGTEGTLSITHTGVVGSGKSVAKIVSAAAQTTGDAGLYVDLSSASSSIPAALIKQAGTGRGIKVVHGSTTILETVSAGTFFRLPTASKANSDSPVTAANTDGIIRCNATSGAITVNLPAVASNSGVTLRYIKTDSTFNAVTLDGNGSETINGATTTTLNTQYEAIELFCDGSAWHILNRRIPGTPTSYTPTVGACGTVTVNECKYTRQGSHCLVEANVTCGTPTGSAFTFSLPSGLTLDYAQETIIGTFGSSYTGGANSGIAILASPANSTSAVYYSFNNTSSIFTRLNGNTFNIGSGTFTLRFLARISGWNA